MIKISVKNISITVLLSFLFFFVVSCGGGTGTIEGVSIQPTPSGEFTSLVAYARGIPPAEFVEKWNNKINSTFKFSYYGQNGLIWPDTDTAEQIYNSHIINCYRISKLLQYIYGGELIFVYQPESNYDHVYLRLENGKIDNNGLTLKFLGE